MPYRQSGSTTTFRSHYKPSSVPRLSRSNAPIKRIYKKKKYLKKPKQNALAINTLARQVRSLQLNSYGQRQYRTDYVSLDSAIPAQFCTTDQPLCFPLNDFYTGTEIYRGAIATQQPFIPSYTTLTATNTWQKQDFEAGLEEEFQWVATNNQAQVSKTTYLPIAVKLKMLFQGNIHQALRDPARYRVTVFKLRKQPLGDSAGLAVGAVGMTLPTYLGAYLGMANDLPRHRNHFSPTKHVILYDKWLSFTPPSVPNATNSINNTISFNHYFDGKKAISINNDVTHPNPPGQTFLTNIPEDEVLWCMISTNITLFTQSSMKIHMSKQVTWRDKKGITTL